MERFIESGQVSNNHQYFGLFRGEREHSHVWLISHFPSRCGTRAEVGATDLIQDPCLWNAGTQLLEPSPVPLMVCGVGSWSQETELEKSPAP